MGFKSRYADKKEDYQIAGVPPVFISLIAKVLWDLWQEWRKKKEEAK